MVPRAGSAPLPPWPCTVSVREGSLGEMHICEGPAASCVPVRPCRVFLRSGSRTTGNATSPGTRTGLPVRVQNVANQLDRLGMESPFSGEQLVTARQPVRLSKPGIWMARSDLRCFQLQRRRWRASCDMRRECRPPCRLMYAAVAVLSVRTSTCSPRKRLLRRFKARCTASNSRQVICQCSWGPVQTPDTASPLNVAPQPLAEASV